MQIDEKIKELKDDIEILDRWLTIASENGVFADEETMRDKQSNTNQSQPISNPKCADIPKSFKEAQEYLKLVWDRLYQEEHQGKYGQHVAGQANTMNSGMLTIGDCETCLSKVLEFYSRSIKKLDRKKRFLINGLHIIGYLTTMLILTVLATLIWNAHNHLNMGLFDTRYSMVIYSATVIGFIGGIIRSMYNIVYEVRMRVFRRASWAEYTMAPFIGGSLAFIVTVGIIGGLITDIQPTLQEQTEETKQSEQKQQNIQQPYGFYIIAFATGLFWRNALNKLSSIVGVKGRLEDRDGNIKRIE
ncbi:hypothetical protein HRbin04_00643 [archaeon HR04]|nr:hypothetical protein HRbin04_00643 [archaeon HR04]